MKFVDYAKVTSGLLSWWKHEGSRRYPEFAALARVYLAVPASSAPSERVFSTLSRLTNRYRGWLDPGRVGCIIRLHENQKRQAPVAVMFADAPIVLQRLWQERGEAHAARRLPRGCTVDKRFNRYSV